MEMCGGTWIGFSREILLDASLSSRTVEVEKNVEEFAVRGRLSAGDTTGEDFRFPGDQEG